MRLTVPTIGALAVIIAIAIIAPVGISTLCGDRRAGGCPQRTAQNGAVASPDLATQNSPCCTAKPAAEAASAVLPSSAKPGLLIMNAASPAASV